MRTLRMVNFDNFGGLKSMLKFYIFIFFNVCIIGTYSSYLWRTGSIFLRCEELVLNFHKCEKYACEELVHNFHKCEE